MNTYQKVNGEWRIRSTDATLAGQMVTVTKRNGQTAQVQLGDRVGAGFGGASLYALAPRAPRATETVGDLSRIIAMFDRARTHLRRPAIVLDGFRVNIAGARAQEPGSLTVTAPERDDASQYGRAWYGRVTRAGEWMPSRDAPEGLGAKLRAFAADPAGVAAEYGRLHGACCFCRRALRDERSTAVGYGPDCADHYGLPWGAREAAPALPRAAHGAGTLSRAQQRHHVPLAPTAPAAPDYATAQRVGASSWID